MEARQRERQNQLRDQAAQGSVLDKVKQVSVLSSSHPYIVMSGILGSDACLLNSDGKPLRIYCSLHGRQIMITVLPLAASQAQQRSLSRASGCSMGH